jgi:hypothetical protein
VRRVKAVPNEKAVVFHLGELIHRPDDLFHMVIRRYPRKEIDRAAENGEEGQGDGQKPENYSLQYHIALCYQPVDPVDHFVDNKDAGLRDELYDRREHG